MSSSPSTSSGVGTSTESRQGSSKYLQKSVGRPHLNLEPVFVDRFANAKGKEKDNDSGWWKFTVSSAGSAAHANTFDEKLDLEKGQAATGPASEFTKKAQEILSQHQAQTPGWSDPWTPFRLHTANPFDLLDPSNVQGPDDPRLRTSQKARGYLSALQTFLLESAFAPFWLRFLNLAFTSVTMALAARIWEVEIRNKIPGLIGTSTMVALVFCPLTIVHIFIALYFEYFGAPIGVWSVRTKMIHTLSELLFIGMWSATLSLAFDDYFTSAAQCTRWTPYAAFRANPGSVQASVPDSLCRLQAALVAMVFISLLLYQCVLVVSLFRIFGKVSRPKR